MNPLTNVKNITKLNEIELSKGTTDKKSWHDIYKGSAWIFIGGLAYGLTEGDVLAVFSQYGEIVNINLVRDKKTGKTKGFCFLCYANQKSTVLAVDNFNGIKLLNRTIRVDHVANYKPPKDNEHDDEVTKILKSEGCAPKPIKPDVSPVDGIASTSTKKKKSKKEKKKHKKDKKGDKSLHKKSKIKKEKHDPGYDKYELPENSANSRENKLNQNRATGSESSTTGDSSDEIYENNKTQPKEILQRKNDTSRNKSIANDFREYNKDGGNKYSSSRKRRSRETESDSEDNYVKLKKTKASQSKGEKIISPENSYSKRKSQYQHDSDSSESSSPTDDRRRYIQKVQSSDHHTVSHFNSSRNAHVSENRRNIAMHQRSGSSSSEEGHHSNPNNRNIYVSKPSNRYQDRDTVEYSKPESSQHKEYDRNNSRSNRSDHMLSNVDDYGDQSFARDRGDHRNTDYGDHSFARDRGDRRNTDYGDHSFAPVRGDCRNTDYRNHSRNNDQSNVRNNDARGSRLHYDEQIHSRKYSDKKDHKSYDYKNEDRNSSKFSKNIRSSSNEREEKHSKHRDRDNNGKNWYDRRKK